MTKGMRVEPSEANNKTEQPPSVAKPEVDKAEPGKPNPAASRKPARSGGGGRGVSLLALLLAAGALGLSGWHWQQARQQQQAQLDLLAQQASQLASANARLDQRLDGVPQGSDWAAAQRLIAEMQRGQQALADRLKVLQGDGRDEWKLAEA